ncbi:lysozyme inhibitor LprI family protein [Legionella maioricensis]|uniref:DUF1311 domain-containing protein n=1 Tax=Legionella maioricensis TaxID=2896528 RepID=A0A9X2IBF7_9GAMM|nr:lysozyme inhibitor LprI family protein [Legionella maioricensis]MCL9684889.1 DUF1311 domain-containing protein [Legionella maioricensis]MCL9688965.1 DUF1311 domain-containing protein [Legionella maioricensis]
MKFYKICLLIVLFFISVHGNARNYEYKGHCTSKIYQNNFEKCLDEELASYDKELNDLYRSFSKSTPHKKLKKIETLWIQFKEADCDYMASKVHGGQYYDDVYKACLINKTKARIADLRRSFLYRGWFKDYRLSN